MTRALGVDLGSRRIGIAISDPRRVLATPYAILDRTSDEHDARAIVEIMHAEEAREIVLGLPLKLDGSRGDAALVAEAFAEKLKTAGASVRLWDERFSTMEADKALRDTGMRGRQRRAVVDRSAATVILQSYLDTKKRETPRGPTAKTAKPHGAAKTKAPDAAKTSKTSEGPQRKAPAAAGAARTAKSTADGKARRADAAEPTKTSRPAAKKTGASRAAAGSTRGADAPSRGRGAKNGANSGAKGRARSGAQSGTKNGAKRGAKAATTPRAPRKTSAAAKPSRRRS